MPDTPDSNPIEPADTQEQAGTEMSGTEMPGTETPGRVLTELALAPQALAVLRLAVAFTGQRNQTRKRKEPLRLSSSALLLAFADTLSLLSTDIDVAFFKRCLTTPFEDGGEKSLKTLFDRWQGTDALDLTAGFEHDDELPSLTANARAILRRAQQLASETLSETIASRHLLAAFLTYQNSPDQTNTRLPYAHERLRRAGHRLADLQLRFFDHLQSQWLEDPPKPWRAILVGQRPHLISRFSDDRPRGTDRLFVGPYAQALAAVIAAWETPQPLSIGIFGDWGSGKSFFMHLLNGAVGNLKKNDSRDERGRRIFCRNIVQIDFNAWHYAESQIWASLVDHILRSLYKPLGEAETRDKLRDLELLGIAKVEAEERLELAEAALLDAETEKERQLNRGEQIWRIEFWQTLPPELVPAKVREGLEKLQDAVGPRETLGSARLAYRQLRGIERARSGILAVIGDLWSHPRRVLLAVGLALSIFLLLSFFDIASWSDSLGWQILGHQIAGILAIVVAFLTPVAGIFRQTWRKLTMVRDWLQANHRRLDNELEKQLKTYQDEVAAARHRVRELEKERDAAKRELEEFQSPKSFSRFLRQRLNDNTYSQHLGVISAVHNDFRTLSDLLLEKAEERRIEQPSNIGDPAVEDHHVDRIVLYIDDLDRCPSSTVVQVLEAIHLLLAFDLFVVVVGVDVRWVAQSLADRYPRHLYDAHHNGSEASHDDHRGTWHCRATPHDYLEKIFQIPFWLPSMGPRASRNLIRSLTTTMDDAAEKDAVSGNRMSDGGESKRSNLSSFEALSTALTDPHVASNILQPTVDPLAETASIPAGIPIQGLASLADEEDVVSPSQNPTLEVADPSLLPTSSTSATNDETVNEVQSTEDDAAAQALSMEEAEISYMEALADAVGHSPRRLKRFVNVYRILKACCTPSEALHFVRDAGHGGEYRAAMTLLALTTGAPTLAYDLYRLLGRQDPHATLGHWHEALRNYPVLREGPPSEADAVYQAFATYLKYEGPATPLRDLQWWARRVVRFTFRSGQL